MINIDKLRYPEHDSLLTKEISHVHNLFFRNSLENKNINIDDQLSVVAFNKEKRAVSFLKEFVLQTKGNRLNGGVYLLYKYKGKRQYYFEGQSRVDRFLTAVRIYKNKRCDSNLYFSMDKTRYYRPFDLRDSMSDSYQDSSNIDSREELNKIKKIYHKLGESKFEKTVHYSKLYNSVKFFNHAYNTKWTLLKTTLFFTALESLFSDSIKSEVAYKVALRTAYFLYPNNAIKRKEVFVFIKRGYDIRSYFVHGSDAETQINKVMKRFEKEKKVDYYGFYHHFVTDLSKIVSSCLSKALLDDNHFSFFSKEKHTSDQENEYFENLALNN